MRVPALLLAIGLVSVSSAFQVVSLYRETSLSAGISGTSNSLNITSTLFPLPVERREVAYPDLSFQWVKSRTDMGARIVDSGIYAGQLSLVNSFVTTSAHVNGTASSYGLLEVTVRLTKAHRVWGNAWTNSERGAIGTVYIFDETRSLLLGQFNNPVGWAGETIFEPGDYRFGMVANGFQSGNGYVRLDQEVIFGFEPVPEPGTLTALGLGALAFLRKKRRDQS